MATTGLRFEMFVDDVEEAARFFETVLGFDVPAGAAFDGYLAITSGPVTIGLNRFQALPAGHPVRGDGPASPRGVGVEVVLEVDDVDATYEVARQHTKRIEPIADRPWGLRDFRVVAPGGFYVRVTSATS